MKEVENEAKQGCTAREYYQSVQHRNVQYGNRAMFELVHWLPALESTLLSNTQTGLKCLHTETRGSNLTISDWEPD